MATEVGGRVKVKMLHRDNGTLILPEAVLLTGAGDAWVQPQFFYAAGPAFLDDDAVLVLPFAATDPSGADDPDLICHVRLRRSDRVAGLADRSEIYDCVLTSEHPVARLQFGSGRTRPDGGMDLRLFHHTADATLPLIRTSGHVRGSAWNYQGTRELTNVGYAYFTSLPAVRRPRDLERMAMATAGRLGLRLDNNNTSVPDLVLRVYRESTRNRTATLPLWVPAEIVTTPHVWQHTGRVVEYEVAHPWIQRVGLQPGAHLGFVPGVDGDVAAPEPAALRLFDYAVIGDCRTVAGLQAPFDEENTTQTFAVQDLAGTDLFDFWRAHANTHLFTPPTDPQQFGNS